MSVPIGNINKIPQADVSHSDTLTASGTYDEYNAVGQTSDNDFSTYHGVHRNNPDDGTCTVSITSEHTWSVAKDLNPVKFKLYARAYPHGNYATSSYTFTVWVKQGTSWTQIYSSSSSGSSDISETPNQTLTTGWEGVTGIKAYAYATAYSYEGDRQQDCYAYVYEVQGFYRKKKCYSGVV